MFGTFVAISLAQDYFYIAILVHKQIIRTFLEEEKKQTKLIVFKKLAQFFVNIFILRIMVIWFLRNLGKLKMYCVIYSTFVAIQTNMVGSGTVAFT